MVETSIIDEVRSLLEKTELEKLQILSFQLDSIRLLACVEIVANDKEGEIAEKAAIVASMRPRVSMLITGWFKLVALYPNPLLEDLLKKMIEVRGFSALLNHKEIPHRLPHWFLSARLPSGILRDYRFNAGNITFERFMFDQNLVMSQALCNVVWLELLTGGHGQDLKRQRPNQILMEMDSRIKTSERMSIGQNYLNRLDGLKDWNEDILNYVLQKWGKPNRLNNKKVKENRFWTAVNQSARDEFSRWLMLEEVESFFDGDRADFWRGYVNNKMIQDVNNILGGEGFMLDFGHFGVIEFKNVGNAAYIYPRDVFEQFWSSATFWTNSPSHFKEVAKTVQSRTLPTWDGRILHHAGWQYTTKDRINILMKEK